MDSRGQFIKAKRIVVKVGTSVLSDESGLSVNRLKVLGRQLSALRKNGKELLVVSSGAIGAGFKKLGLEERPKVLRLKQACAAVGQLGLMTAWDKALAAEGVLIAQILLSADDLADRARFLNAKNTLATLLERGVLPIINENDTVAVDELKVGDNDTLAALVASLVEADLFINLTDLAGLYDGDPRQNPEAKLISQVDHISPKILALAGGSGGPLGTGGMYTKVRAAKRLAEQRLASVIANGRERDILIKIIDGQDVGTFFKPKDKKMAGKKHWLAFAAKVKGNLSIDQGAAQALIKRGKSLLPGGVTRVEGAFAAGDAVRILDDAGELLALGLVNYSSAEAEKLKGHRSRDIHDLLGYSHSDEIVHRDNMVLYQGLL